MSELKSGAEQREKEGELSCAAPLPNDKLFAGISLPLSPEKNISFDQIVSSLIEKQELSCKEKEYIVKALLDNTKLKEHSFYQDKDFSLVKNSGNPQYVFTRAIGKEKLKILKLLAMGKGGQSVTLDFDLETGSLIDYNRGNIAFFISPHLKLGGIERQLVGERELIRGSLPKEISTVISRYASYVSGLDNSSIVLEAPDLATTKERKIALNALLNKASLNSLYSLVAGKNLFLRATENRSAILDNGNVAVIFDKDSKLIPLELDILNRSLVLPELGESIGAEMNIRVAEQWIKAESLSQNEDGIVRQNAMSKEDIAKFAIAVANTYQVDPTLVLSIIAVESHFNPLAKSAAGAFGPMQVTQITRDEVNRVKLGEYERGNPIENIIIGVKYLKILQDRFTKDEDFQNPDDLVVAAYNAGPTIVAQLKRVPNYSETIKYLSKVKQAFLDITQGKDGFHPMLKFGHKPGITPRTLKLLLND